MYKALFLTGMVLRSALPLVEVKQERWSSVWAKKQKQEKWPRAQIEQQKLFEAEVFSTEIDQEWLQVVKEL